MNKIKKTIVIALVFFSLCFISGLFTILISNQDKVTNLLEFIGFLITIGFSVFGLLFLVKYFLINQNEQTNKNNK